MMENFKCDACGNCVPSHGHSVCVVHLEYIFPSRNTCGFYTPRVLQRRSNFKRKSLLWLLVVLAILLPSLSFATTFQVGGVCYPDHLSAKQAWLEQFPTAPDAGGVIWFVQTAGVDASGLITGVLKNSDGVTKTMAGLQLKVCSEQTASRVFDKFPLQDMVLPMALVVVFVLGFGQGKSSL